ncbi:META domain-containing protein [Fluviicoccus keumensis]|nr:META domain-containing protein [Fluviicoccus keumensis]
MEAQQPVPLPGAVAPTAETAARASFEVAGRPWRLRNLPFAVADRSASQREAFVTFKSGGSVMEGNTGCNPIRASYELQGAALRIRNLEGTLMPCPDGVTFEALFIQALSDTAEWREDDGALVLLNADGYQLAIFDRTAP